MKSRGYAYLYRTRAWREGSKNFLTENPWCWLHLQRGERVLAVLVDHHRPHKGNEELFFNVDNWRPMCRACHDGPKRKAERSKSGIIPGCDARGMPLDKENHPWWQD